MIEINISYGKNDLKLETLNRILFDIEQRLKEEDLKCLCLRQANHKAYLEFYSNHPKQSKLYSLCGNKECVIFIEYKKEE